ncbi:hypothetical protein XH86_26925 [Bradyrhizobium guangdongense]|uniref:Uncharacterized protein n=1 Tax=Bradyrhizobium guangdongense TaxID=1325090 RepID=A0ABX6UL96_9BRAD|nr:hypothetical protein X265_26900 [Bradyrhizobium guangdongense]QOZ61972.1 hypothetical protein XH86_26925 [Bradyrhizobium guangdongense]
MSGRGVGVRSVASRRMAAGLPGPTGPEAGMQDVLRPDETDQSRPLKRFTLHRSGLLRRMMPSGTAVSTQEHTEIVFEGTESSCYPWCSLGAEGIVSSTSRRPN